MNQAVVHWLQQRVVDAKRECGLAETLRRVAGGATDYDTIASAYARWTLREWCRAHAG